MGNSLCSPQTPGATPEGSVKEVLGVLKKAARPSSRWQDLAPSVGQWYQELEAILRALQENGFGSNGADMDKVKRTTMVCIGTVKGVYYWVKEINANFGQGTDGPMIGRAAAVRLERALKPHLAILQAHRDDCLQNPSTFFAYALMSLRPAVKDHMRWVDQKFKEWDEQVLDEMESSKQDLKRAGSSGAPAWQSQVANERRPIALYCDGQHIGAIDPVVYATKLGQRH